MDQLDPTDRSQPAPRHAGALYFLLACSTPPSGEGDRAEISVRVPLAFAGALPETAVAQGIRGVVAAVVATAAARSPSQASPANPRK